MYGCVCIFARMCVFVFLRLVFHNFFFNFISWYFFRMFLVFFSRPLELARQRWRRQCAQKTDCMRVLYAHLDLNGIYNTSDRKDKRRREVISAECAQLCVCCVCVWLIKKKLILQPCGIGCGSRTSHTTKFTKKK